MDEDAVARLMRALLPGGAGFPPASGEAARLLAERLRHAGVALPSGLPADGTAAAALESGHPSVFAELRKYAYLTYYEQPEAIAAIRALGHPYNDAPLPDGYPDETFDPARDAPRTPRGRWLDDAGITPVDPATLGLVP